MNFEPINYPSIVFQSVQQWGETALIGASANMITAGIAERVGYRITYKYFLKKGFPALVNTVNLSLLWLFIRF